MGGFFKLEESLPFGDLRLSGASLRLPPLCIGRGCDGCHILVGTVAFMISYTYAPRVPFKRGILR